MTKLPLFSIIVPIYKVEKYLNQCVESLLSQDYDDYEIILVDDGSPDRCPQLCDEFASSYTNIRVVHKQNGGLSDARNAGVNIAKGRYVTFVDSDDFWRGTDVLSGVAKIITDNNDPDVIVSDFIKYYELTNKYIKPDKVCSVELNGKSKQSILEYLYFCQADMKMSACQKFVKNELLTKISFTKSLLSEDIDWSLQLYPIINSICVYDKPYYCYRQQREGSITNTASQRSFDSLIHIIQKWSERIPNLSIPQSEKDIYLGYLAYQLSITISLVANLDKTSQSDAIKVLNDYKWLFTSKLNHKTKKVKMILDLFGLKPTISILHKFLKLRHLLQRTLILDFNHSL